MSIWSTKRQLTYASIFFAVVFGILAIILKPIYTKAPTCFDNVKNGDERGVDCGGSCVLMCIQDTVTPLVLWARSYPATDTVYNAVAYIENQNSSSYGFNALYEFRLYDEKDFLIAKVEGDTFVNPNGRQIIFYPGIEVGNRVPKRTVFSFTKQPTWYKSSVNMSEIPISINDVKRGGDDSKPYVTSVIKNNSRIKIPKFDVFALVYDENNNVRNVSKTVIDGLNREEEAIASFTWNMSLGDGILRYVVEPVIDTAMIKNANK